MADTGVRSTDTPELASADDLMAHKDGTVGRVRVTTTLATQIAASGAVADRLDLVEKATAYANVYRSTWADLALLTPAGIGQGAEVDDGDAGTHTDPNTAATVANAGRYTAFGTGVGEWTWIGGTGLSSKVDKAARSVEGNYIQPDYRASAAALARLEPGLRRAQPELLLDFELGGFSDTDDYGNLAAAAFPDLATCTRDSAATYTDRNDAEVLAAANEPLLEDWSTGARGLRVLPGDGSSREPDVITLNAEAEQAGTYWFDFDYDPAAAYGVSRGLFAVCGNTGAPLALEGVCFVFRASDDLPQMFLRDSTGTVFGQLIDATTLVTGRNTMKVTYDLVAGTCSAQINGGVVSTRTAETWTAVAPARTLIGHQEVVGSDDRQFNGTIYRVARLADDTVEVSFDPLGSDPATRDAVAEISQPLVDAAAATAEDQIATATGINLRQAQIAGIVPLFGADFAKGGYAVRDSAGASRPKFFDDLFTVTRASTADGEAEDGSTLIAAINAPCWDYSRGGRGLFCSPENGARAAEEIRLNVFAKQKGAVLIEFWNPNTPAIGTTLQGLFCTHLTGAFQGASFGIDPATNRINMHMRDAVANQQNVLFDLVEGVNRALFSWDLATGACAVSLNGGAVYNVAAPAGWTGVVPSKSLVGDQNTIGSEPRQYYGNIASIYGYSERLGAPIATGGELEAAIMEATSIGRKDHRGVELIYPHDRAYIRHITPRKEQLRFDDKEGRRFSVEARTGDYSVTGDVGKKVRGELQWQPGFANDGEVWMVLDIMVPRMTVTEWTIIQQWHQGGSIEGEQPGEPPVTLQLNTSNELMLIANRQDPGDPGESIFNILATIPIVEGRWHRIHQRVQFSLGAATGSMEVYLDGIEIYSGTGQIFGYNRADNVSCKIGVYRGLTAQELLYVADPGTGAQESFVSHYGNWQIFTEEPDDWPASWPPTPV